MLAMATATSTRHLLGLRDMPHERLLELLGSAAAMRPVVDGVVPSRNDLDGCIVANLFLENSTRTRCSFSVAAQRLGAGTIDLLGGTSSASKGESLVDTAANIAAMGVDAIVLRCNASGGAALVAEQLDIPVLNAGDGRHEHPTQGLLDALTLVQHCGSTDLSSMHLAIVGDLATSRVARSAVYAMTALGCNVTLVGPEALVPDTLAGLLEGLHPVQRGTLRIARDFDSILPTLDAIMMLRIQFERHGGGGVPGDYRAQWGLTASRARLLPKHAVVLHPGPVNRDLELDAAVCDGPRSLVLNQVTNGVAVRMASLLDCLAAS
jgi:aspartate carbamoyltransferase catalytic subunit